MSTYIIPLHDSSCADHLRCGHKAASLHQLISQGIRVPQGLCVTKTAYLHFIEQTGIKQTIIMELGRKDLTGMRWEELWDASLRIRNMFSKTPLPESLKKVLYREIQQHCGSKPVVVRSSSLSEDSAGTSYAGIHESYVNIVGTRIIVQHIKLVWASLWSDAALAYSRELALDIDTSSMPVVIQRLVIGKKSGIAFSVNPNNLKQAVIEAVYGLNKGLVDGDVEPDRWFLSRTNGARVGFFQAQNKKQCISASGGVEIQDVPASYNKKPVLTPSEVKKIFTDVKTIEKIKQSPQDIEWTIDQDKLYILQARPITTGVSQDTNTRRVWDLSLRRSYYNLVALAEKIENELLPHMIREADALARDTIAQKTDDELVAVLRERKKAYDKWKAVYWDEFIPFAHGVRLFGTIYNERVKPEDPYEFVDLLVSGELESVKRNKYLEDLAESVRKDGRPAKRVLASRDFTGRLDTFMAQFSGLSCDITKCADEKEMVKRVICELVRAPARTKRKPKRASLKNKYLKAFAKKERDFAESLLALARKSYRLRDDDNIYLGKYESLLAEALAESKKRLGGKCENATMCENPDEVLHALVFPSYTPKKMNGDERKKETQELRARQLRGQPAGEGIARGYARVIKAVSDLGKVKQGEILVSDAIDPTMTFVIPIIKGIIECRGGMLIHGAIIAREYGLPCVTGISNATELIRTGDFVTVDGYYGLVIIHSDTELTLMKRKKIY